MFRKVALAAGLALAFSGAAQAQASGWYAGAGIGWSSVDLSDSVLPVTGATASTLSKDEDDTGYKLFAGYRFNQNLAVEGSWTDLGKFSATRNVTAPAVGSVTGNVKTNGWNVDVVGLLPLQNNFTLYGKVGAFFSTTKTSLSTSGAVVLAAGTDPNRKKSETNVKWGLGAEYDFSKTTALRAEWERFENVGDNRTGESDVDLLSVGLQFRF